MFCPLRHKVCQCYAKFAIKPRRGIFGKCLSDAINTRDENRSPSAFVLRIKRVLSGSEIDEVIADIPAREVSGRTCARRKRWEGGIGNAARLMTDY